MSHHYAMLAAIALALPACSGGNSDDSDAIGDGDTPAPEQPLTYSPIVGYESIRFQDRPVKYYIPPDPKGVTWLFHGTNGDAAYCTRIETVATTNLLILEGVGFICSESLEQGPENQWDTWTEDFDQNPDVQFLLDLHDEIVQTTDLEASTPQFTLGFSNGGDMAGYFAMALEDAGHDIRAVAPHSSGGHAWLGSKQPMIFILPEHDDVGRQPAYGVQEEREQKGIPTEYWEPPELTITPDFFIKNPTVTAEASQKVFDEMIRLGMIDEEGTRLVDVADAEQACVDFEIQANVAVADLRGDEIRVGWALHRMNAYYAHRVRDFFLGQLD